MRLAGRTAVVTGASSGIGRATALHLAGRGMRVVASARSADRLESLAAEHPGIETVVADVTSAADRHRLVEAAGPVDLLVNNAGLGWTGLVEDMAEADVLRLWETNVVGLVEMTRLVLPGMLERRRGHVVNVSSVAAFVSFPPLSVYCATKSAVQAFTRGLQREVWGSGVSVSTLNPGPINTEFGLVAAGVTTVGPAAAPGLGARLCARAVARSARLGGLPGFRTVSVPRVMGAGRVLGWPVVSGVLDLVFLVLRAAGLRKALGRMPGA